MCSRVSVYRTELAFYPCLSQKQRTLRFRNYRDISFERLKDLSLPVELKLVGLYKKSSGFQKAWLPLN